MAADGPTTCLGCGSDTSGDQGGGPLWCDRCTQAIGLVPAPEGRMEQEAAPQAVSQTRYEAGIPVLIGEACSRTHCRVWCPWCRRYHTHGRGDGTADDFEGHRAAHCGGGPFKATGYYVVSARTAARMRPARFDTWKEEP